MGGIDVASMAVDDFYFLNHTRDPNTMGVVTDATEAAARSLGSGSYTVALVPADEGVAVVEVRSGHAIGFLSQWAVSHYALPIWNITAGGKLARTKAELAIYPDSAFLQVHMRENIKELVHHDPELLGSPKIPEPNWESLLAPDGTLRANLFQRGYVRGTIGKHFPSNRAPRIDYATVGQCEKILDHFGEPTDQIKKRSSIILKGLWWILLALLAIVALIGLVTAPVGLIFTALVVGPFVYHYVTRARLEAPFGKQQP